MKKYSFIVDGDIVLETENQMMDFIAALLAEEILIEEPKTLAQLIRENQEDVAESGLEEFFVETGASKEPRFILSEAEQMLRSSFNQEPKDTVDRINNLFIEIYETLDATFHEKTSTYLDFHEPGEFDLTTNILRKEIEAAKQALVAAKMSTIKAFTNDLMR